MSELRVEIDQNQLDVEWLNQPVQFHFWAVELANARLEMDTAKSALEVAKAEVEREIREVPLEYDIGKVTESAIAAATLLQPEYKKAVEVLNTAKHRVAIVQAAVDALDQRKKALENLVTLHCSGYFAEPRVAGEAKEEMEDVVKRRVRSGLRREGKGQNADS